ncbi:MAG TPA: site-specific integrase, partial [Gemmatimonadaceae bacterium]|nr:site-specific integrase [Gemmatimonadaceae bacterium]
WLSAEEIAMAKESCHAEWWTLFAMLIHTGMRVGEAQGLRWSDIDLQARVIAIRDHAGRRLKTKSSNRDVPISEDLASLIIIHAQRVPSRPIDPVFTGARANRRAARATWLRVLQRAGVPHATVHDLRHTFAVHALQAGIPLSRVQKWLGHSTATMTLRYASHVPQDYFRQDAELLSRSIAGLPNQAQLRLISDSAANSQRFA